MLDILAAYRKITELKQVLIYSGDGKFKKKARSKVHGRLPHSLVGPAIGDKKYSHI
jgi:hypothetical protein